MKRDGISEIGTKKINSFARTELGKKGTVKNGVVSVGNLNIFITATPIIGHAKRKNTPALINTSFHLTNFVRNK